MLREVKVEAVAPRVLCPHCHCDRIRREERKGFLQIKFLPLLGYYPWRCGVCRKTYYLRIRDHRRSEYPKRHTNND